MVGQMGGEEVYYRGGCRGIGREGGEQMLGKEGGFLVYVRGGFFIEVVICGDNVLRWIRKSHYGNRYIVH